MAQKILSEEDMQKISEIADIHSEKTSSGAVIYLICPKTTIGPQAMAMIQALYSRDPSSILGHLLEVAIKGADKFMEQYFVNYGHKSIGDCGNILLAFEGISMLAAKAAQDSQQYAGQEASTRYMDFSDQMFLAPAEHTGFQSVTGGPPIVGAPKRIQEIWRSFYMDNMPIVLEHLKQQYPYEQFDVEKHSEKDWLKTMKARAFDIMRGFLPAGATTFVAWWTSISHCGEHLSWLRCHVLPEVSELANKTEELLKRVYPSSFERKLPEDPIEREEHLEKLKKREEYKKKWFASEYYLDMGNRKDFTASEYVVKHHMMMTGIYREAVLTRPKGVDLPWQIGEAISVHWGDMLDFGSFRDLQRHRAVIQRMGLLTAEHGMHEWYMENLPAEVKTEAEKLLKAQLEAIAELQEKGMDKYSAQYLLPMGMKIPTRVSGSLSKVMYLIELRCQRTVHPTLHANAFYLAKSVRFQLSQIFNCKEEEIPMYIDPAVGELTLKRGTQDIVKNED